MALTGATNEEKIWNFLKGKGLNDYGTAGLMGNLFAESGLDPQNLENLCERRLKEAGKAYCTDKAYTAAVDAGQIGREEFLHPLPGKQYGYGLAQWTSPGRKAGLYDLVKSKGVSIGDLETQLEFLVKELSASYKGILSVLKTAESVKAASDKVLTGFECPADMGIRVQEKRAGYGQKYFTQYGKEISMVNAADKVIAVALAEVGYLEKRSNKDLDSKTANAGSDNFTKYARDLYPALQGQAWCDMFVDWCFVQAFGKVKAQQLIGGGFSAYTPISAQYYKNKGQYHKSGPLPGDQIFFRNSQRICHTGFVEKATSTKVYTVEGNTSAGATVIPNGGEVCRKEYLLTAGGIDGYGRPNWSLVEKPKYTVGWYHDAFGWWYADTESTYFKSCWQVINGHRYYFNAEGYAVIDWQEIDGRWYYFEPRAGHPLECALYVSDANGVQDIGWF